MNGYSETQIEAAYNLKRWRDKTNGCLWFATEELKFDPDPWQVQGFIDFASDDPKKRRLALKACKGVGKTAFLAICILWFMVTQSEPGEHPKGAATSITEDNIDDNLWPEIAKWQSRSPTLTRAFKWTKSRYFNVDYPETWFFSKRTWPKGGAADQQANTLAGLHSKYLLFVADESGDIPDAVLAAADAGLTGTELGRFQKILQAGNPTRLDGPLYRACHTEKDIWTVIEITGDPDNPNRSRRQSAEWAREQIKRYGIDSPWVLVNVFGTFPSSSINALLSDVQVRTAMGRNLHSDAYKDAQKRIGVDVARFGDDMSVLAPRQGMRAFNFVELSGWRGTEVAEKIINSKLKWDSELEFVDGTGGFGSGVVDAMVQRGYNPMEVHFSSKAMDQRYYNIRAEMYFRFAEWVKTRGQLPFDEKLLKELCATTYTSKGGKIILSPKEIIKEQLGFSPDRADAYALTFALPEAPGRSSIEAEIMRGKGGMTKHEYDPLAFADLPN